MAGLGTFSYIERDYADILSAITERISKITPEWTDMNQSDIGITILQLLTGMTEMLAYTEDQHANQLTLPTCTQRESMINLCNSLAYTMANVTASSVDLIYSRTPYTTTDSAADTTLAGLITAQNTQSFLLTDASEYGSKDVMLLNNGTNTEYVVVNYKIGNNVTIYGVTRYSYLIGNAVKRIERAAVIGGSNVVIPDNLKNSTSGAMPFIFETNTPNANYILYGGFTYVDQTIVLAYNSTNKTITVSNVFDYAIGDSLYVKSTVYETADESLAISNISGRVLTFTEIPVWIQVGDIVSRMVPAAQGQTRSENLAASTGLPDQSRELTFTPVVDTSVIVEVNEGSGKETWTLVDSFYGSDSNDKHFTLTIQANDKALTKFGDGVNGKIPLLNAVPTATYTQGGGVDGNVGAQTINKISGTVTNVSGSTVSLTVLNPDAASGGSNKESLDIARDRASALYSAAYRAVSSEDYESLSNGFTDSTYGTIVKSKGLESQVDNAVSLYVWTSDANGFATATSSGLKAALLTYLEPRAGEGYLVTTLDGSLLSVNIIATVYVATGSVQSVVRTAVLAIIDTLFQADILTPGEDFYLSNLYEAIENVEGVDRVDITLPLRPGVYVGPIHMAVKGIVSLTMSGGSA